MARARQRHRPRLLIAAAAVTAVTVPWVAAWIASPRVADLQARVSSYGHATGAGTPVPLGQISLLLRQALVATEDERFYQNHGIDLIGIARAIPYDLGISRSRREQARSPTSWRSSSTCTETITHHGASSRTSRCR